MPEKRGRPITIQSNNPAIVRRREKTAERVRRYHERKRAERDSAVTVVAPQTNPAEHNAVSRLCREEWSTSVSHSQFSASPESRINEMLRDQEATQWQSEQADYTEPTLQRDDADVDAPSRHASQHDKVVTMDLEDTTIHTVQTEQSQESTTQYDGPESQNCAADVGISIWSEQEEQTNAVNQQSLLRRRRLAAARQRRYRDRQRALQGLPPRIRKEDLQHGETMIDFTTSIDNRAENTTLMQPDKRISGILQPSIEHHMSESSRSAFIPSVNDENLQIDPAGTSARVITAQKLCNQMILGFRGCSSEQHRQQLQDHVEAEGNNHFGLDEIFNESSMPSVLGQLDVAKDYSNKFQTLSGSQWNEMFCGGSDTDSQGTSPVKNVCLHKEQTQSTTPDVSFDVDSFLGFATSLGVARNGLLYQPSPLAQQNLSSDVHFDLDVSGIDRRSRGTTRSSFAMLRDVPHFFLGRLVGAENVTLHLFLPHLEVSQGTSVLTTAQLTRWNDLILHPAIYKHLPAHFTQHLPAGYQHAFANSKARQVEARKIKTASYQSQQSISYCLPSEYLVRVWQDVQETIACTPGLHDFREAQLYLSAKGTKLQFKASPSCPTLCEAIENFQAYLEQNLNLQYVESDRFFVDIGKEVCPPVSSLISDHDIPESEAQVYSWKRCCLEEYLKLLYDGQPPAMGGPGQRYYEQNMLYQASSLTSKTPRYSKLREGGLLYSQFYGSVKEISDASKCKPFDNDGIEDLALDPQVRQGIRTVVGGHLRDHSTMEQAYTSSKGRANIALSTSREKSFGIREEHRISWQLFQSIRSQASLHSQQAVTPTLNCCPSYAWGVKTKVYLDFLRRSADKFAMGFETVLANVQKGFISQEETKMMAMFLRCLRFVFGGHQLQRESALWWSRKERHGEKGTWAWCGLGFSNTLPRHGYCWLEPRFDWERLRFHPDFTDQVLFGNNVLHNQQLRRGAEMTAFLNSVQRLEMAVGWLRQYSHVAEAQSRLISWIVHICLQQFRVDILHRVKGSIRPHLREEVLKGQQPFCVEYFREILAEKIYMISSNRSDIKSVSTLTHLLFGFDDEFARTYWRSLPFRALCRRAINGIQIRDSEVQKDENGRLEKLFRQRLWRRLLSYHWILPYPNRDSIIQRNKRGDRMWYSIISRKEDFVEEMVGVMQTRSDARRGERTRSCGQERSQRRREEYIGDHRWVWGRKMWQAGRPEAIPWWVWWTKEEWIAWLNNKGTSPN